MSLASLLALVLEATSMASPRSGIQRPVPVRAALPPLAPTRAAPLLLEIRGPIPEDFRGDPSDKIPALEGRNGKELGFWASRSNSSEKRDWKEFWWRQLSLRRDLALRGWALFGDSASRYLEQVKDEVLVSEPALRDRIRVYACPSPYVNAMMLPDGVTLVNLGFLARLEDESQLALVLAHEAAHFALRHAEDSWWENRDGSSSGSDRWAKTRFQHSREREAQADSLALKYLVGSRYATTSIDSLFGILDASDNAQGQRAWTRQALEPFPDLLWPDSSWLDASKTRTAPPETEDEDSLRTHPAIPRRRAASKRILASSRHEGQTWVVGQEPFLAVREAARNAVPNGWLEADQPAAALFEAWSLLAGDPSSPELNDVFRHSLVDLALDRAAARRTAPRARRLRIWGAYETLDHFLKRTDDARMLALGQIAARSMVRANPDDSLAARFEPEILDEWAKALPRHLEYLRDTTKIARSLRRHRQILDRIRQVVPELAGDIKARADVPDTGSARWGGTAVLADIDWGSAPQAKPLGGIEGGKRRIRSALVSAFAGHGVSLVAPDPSAWTSDSLDALRRQSEIRDWALERLDSRGATRFRPRLPRLRQQLAAWKADKVLLVSLDYGPPETSFDRVLSPMRVAWFGDARNAWYFPQPYLMGAVFDARDGAVLGVARVKIGESTSETFLAEAATKLVKKLSQPR